MRLLTLLMTAACLVIATGPGAMAQTTPSKSAGRKGSALTPAAPPLPSLKAKSTSQRSINQRKTTRYSTPPAPNIPIRSSARTTARATRPGLVGVDETGRRDQAGRSVPFYPTVRGALKPGARSASPSSQKSGYTPRNNPQKLQ